MEDDLERTPDSAGTERAWRWPGAASTPDSETSPAHYLLLEGLFFSGLAGLVALTRRREGAGAPPIPVEELPVLALATFALSDVVAKERISTWIREPFTKENSDHKPLQPEGEGLRYAIGELLTCTRCVGTWSALALVSLRTGAPAAGRATSVVLALAGANDLMQSGFRLLAEKTNLTARKVEAMHKPRPPA